MSYSKSNLVRDVQHMAFGKVAHATYSVPGTALTIEYSRFGTLIGTSKTRPFLFRSRGYANLSQALEALNESSSSLVA